MNIIVKIGITLCMAALTITARAEEPLADIFNKPLTEETMGAFRAACAVLAEHPVVKGSFEQEKKLNKLNRSLKSSGNFIIAAGQGMVWETLKPFPSTLVLGKSHLIQSRPGGTKTLISAQGNETFIRLAEVLSAVFSGNSQSLLDNFTVFFTAGTGGVDNSWELGLLPRDSAIMSFAARLYMRGDSAIRSIIIHEQNGDAITYLLSNQHYPGALSTDEKNLFTIP